MVTRMRAPEPEPLLGALGARAGAGVGGAEARRGLRLVLRQPVLRALGLSNSLGSFFGNFYATLYALYALRDLQLGPALLGLAVACGGAGGLAGTLVATRASRRFGVGPTIVGTALLNALVARSMTPRRPDRSCWPLAFLVTGQLLGDGLATRARSPRPACARRWRRTTSWGG